MVLFRTLRTRGHTLKDMSSVDHDTRVETIYNGSSWDFINTVKGEGVFKDY